MAMCTINCDNNKVEVYVLLSLFCKISLNKPNDNFRRSVSHKSLFEGLLSECDGGVAIVRHGESLKVTLMKQDTCIRP